MTNSRTHSGEQLALLERFQRIDPKDLVKEIGEQVATMQSIIKAQTNLTGSMYV